MECISYKKGYKYQLSKDYKVSIGIKPDQRIENDYIILTIEGNLIIKKGYAWDGPSGPTLDTRNFMRGSLVHDALYQLMRNNESMKPERYKDPADRLLQEMCIKDGMSRVRAWQVYHGVRLFGKPATSSENKKELIYAPKSCEKKS